MFIIQGLISSSVTLITDLSKTFQQRPLQKLILCNIQIFWDTEFKFFIICKP